MSFLRDIMDEILIIRNKSASFQSDTMRSVLNSLLNRSGYIDSLYQGILISMKRMRDDMISTCESETAHRSVENDDSNERLVENRDHSHDELCYFVDNTYTLGDVQIEIKVESSDDYETLKYEIRTHPGLSRNYDGSLHLFNMLFEERDWKDNLLIEDMSGRVDNNHVMRTVFNDISKTPDRDSKIESMYKDALMRSKEIYFIGMMTHE